MKKYILAIIAMMFLMTSNVDAQSKLKFGIMCGMNISEMRFDQDIIDKDNQAGFFFGPMADLNLPIFGLNLDAAILYDQQKVGALDESEELKFIEIPINVKYNIGIGSMLSAYIATGPQFSFNVGDSNILKYEYKLKSSQLSWNVGVGLKIANHLVAGYRYNIGLGDYADRRDLGTGDIIDTVKKKDGTHHLHLAYIF